MPERVDLKRGVLTQIDAAADPKALIGSSTSGLMPTDLQRDMKHPERMFVAHPYNPVYLLPLAELVGGEKTAKSTLEEAKAKLAPIGMKGVIINKEIEAFVGDRLLEAVWREGLWLIKDDICDTETLDDVIRYSFGMRWAQMGMFETYRIAGGEAGMRHFLAQFGPCLSWPWTKLMDVVDLDDELVDKIASQSDAQSGARGIRDLERIRDENLVGIMQALKGGDGGKGWGAGKLLADFEQSLWANAEKPKTDLGNAQADPHRRHQGQCRLGRLQRPHDRTPLPAGLRRYVRRPLAPDRRRSRLCQEAATATTRSKPISVISAKPSSATRSIRPARSCPTTKSACTSSRRIYNARDQRSGCDRRADAAACGQ